MTVVCIRPVPVSDIPLELCPAERLEYIDSASSNELRRMRAAATDALLCACERFGVPLPFSGLHRAENGSWQADDFYLSLSHCRGFAAAAVSDKTVGIDIEPVSRAGSQMYALARRMCTPTELNGRTDPRRLLELWTKKEAIFKCSGSDIFRPDVIETAMHPVFMFEAGENRELILSLCSRDEACRIIPADESTVLRALP